MYSQNPDAAPLLAYYKWYHSVNVPHIPCTHFRSDLSQQGRSRYRYALMTSLGLAWIVILRFKPILEELTWSHRSIKVLTSLLYYSLDVFEVLRNIIAVML